MRPTTFWMYSLVTFGLASSHHDSRDCAVSSGSFGKVAFRYHAHSKNCATMSESGLIESALYHNFQQLDEDEIPTSACIKFDEGGSWEGYVLYGRLGEVDLTGCCGPKIGSPEASSHGEL
jgi:hypothetical protein